MSGDCSCALLPSTLNFMVLCYDHGGEESCSFLYDLFPFVYSDTSLKQFISSVLFIVCLKSCLDHVNNLFLPVSAAEKSPTTRHHGTEKKQQQLAV